MRERFWTALALALVAVSAVLWLPTAVLALAIAPVIVLGVWELAPLLGLSRLSERLGYLASVLVALALGWLLLEADQPGFLLWPVALAWLAITPVLFVTRAVRDASGIDYPLVLLSFPVLVAPWLGVLVLHQSADAGPWMVLFVLMLVWLMDSAAYFAGRRFGRRKLAPAISPGKTVEGVIGGLLAVGLWSLALLPMAGGASWWWLLLLTLLSAGVSVVGDLVESWLKRRRHLKDAGSLLPGHGGMLDRIDSMVAAVPVFALGFLIWERTL